MPIIVNNQHHSKKISLLTMHTTDRLKMWMMIILTAIFGALCNADRLDLSILDFGGKADDMTNNQPAIDAAIRACEANGKAGCTLTFPVPTGHVPISPPPYHPWGPPPLAVFRTSAFNLTSHLRLVVETGVQLRGTENFADNCGGSDNSTCDNWDSASWPILPSSTYPSAINKPGPPVKQAFIRGYNLTDVEITGGGELHGGGGWWWCVRMLTAKQPSGGHAPKWCTSMVAAGKIPKLTYDAPHMLHFIGSHNIVLSNLTISNSPMWTVHFQYCNNVTLRHALVFNPNNGSIEAPNADGIDVDSSSNVHVHDCIFDVGDDMLCVKSGMVHSHIRTHQLTLTTLPLHPYHYKHHVTTFHPPTTPPTTLSPTHAHHRGRLLGSPHQHPLPERALRACGGDLVMSPLLSPLL